MFDDQPGWLQFIGSFGMPIVVAILVVAAWWDRRRSTRTVLPRRPDAWHKALDERPAPSPKEPPQPYTVYTREFDLELDAREIPARLKEASPDYVRGRTESRLRFGWPTALGLARQFARKERPANDIAAELRRRIGDNANGLAVTLLLDQSGSMRGAPITATAAALAQVENALSEIGAATEILGFTTAGWQGGYARAKWISDGRPQRPGRLCALLHIVYKSAAGSEWTRQSREAMLHPDVLRENVDGEALDWAAARLAVQPQCRKLLIILSDGAPVDDSTLQENQHDFLERDTLRAIAAIEARDDMILGAIGIGHAVSRYYAHSRESRIGAISGDLITLIGDLALQHNPATAPASLGE